MLRPRPHPCPAMSESAVHLWHIVRPGYEPDLVLAITAARIVVTHTGALLFLDLDAQPIAAWAPQAWLSVERVPNTVTEDGRYLVMTVWQGTDDRYRITWFDLQDKERKPIDLIETSQPLSVVCVTVFQLFVTEARSVTFKAARWVDAVSRAGAASAASRLRTAAEQVKPKKSFMAAGAHGATRRGKFQAVRFVE